ncbi:MAG: hypothetical protein EOM21_13010 [Gammaproteobacteria bacterium]|nr:hypothetical protein [Gammaproteobacteria bacterium]
MTHPNLSRPAELPTFEDTAALLSALPDRLTERAKSLAEETWSDEHELRLHQDLGAAFDQLERTLRSLGIAL